MLSNTEMIGDFHKSYLLIFICKPYAIFISLPLFIKNNRAPLFVRCTPNFDIQQEVSFYKSEPLLPVSNNEVRVKVSIIFGLGSLQLFILT